MKKTIVCCMLFVMTGISINAIAQSSNKPKAVINHLAIHVVDLRKSANFYINIMGLDTIPEPFKVGKHVWLRIGPGSSLHIIAGAPERKEYYKNNHICFSVESVEAFTEILRRSNIPWEDLSGKKMAISSRIDGVKQIWLQDPDGYWLEVNDAKE